MPTIARFEEPNVMHCQYLLSISKDEFMMLFPSMKEKNCISHYKKILNYCREAIKTNGKIPRTYEDKTEKGGRYYCQQPMSFPDMKREVRAFLLAGTGYVDYDIERCAPSILYNIYLSIKSDDDNECIFARDFIEKRDIWLNNAGITKDDFKHHLFCDCSGFDIIRSYNLHNTVNDWNYIKQKLKPKAEELGFESNKDSKSPLGSLISHFVYYFESKLLLQRLPPTGIPVYDGFLCKDKVVMERFQPIFENAEDTEYASLGVNWTTKPITTNVQIPDTFVYDPIGYVKSDRDCMVRLLELYPHMKSTYHGEFFVFNTENGMWKKDKDYIEFKKILKRFRNQLYLEPANEKQEPRSYADYASMVKKVETFAISETCDENFFKNNDTSGLGKLLFKDVIFDMTTQEVKDFDPNIIFFDSITYDLPKRPPQDDIDLVKKVFFQDPFIDDHQDVGEYLLTGLARAIAGDAGVDYEKIFCLIGEGSAGKTQLFNMLGRVFCDYVGVFNSSVFEYKKTSSDSASDFRWALLLKYKRILLAEEWADGIAIDGTKMNKLSAQSNTMARTHHGEEQKITMHGTMVFCANGLPEIKSSGGGGIKRRLEILSYLIKFLRNPDPAFPKYEKPIDRNLNRKVKTPKYINAFLWLILDRYYEYYNAENKDIYTAQPKSIANSNDDFDEGNGFEAMVLRDFLIGEAQGCTENDVKSNKELRDWLQATKTGANITRLKQFLLKRGAEQGNTKTGTRCAKYIKDRPPPEPTPEVTDNCSDLL